MDRRKVRYVPAKISTSVEKSISYCDTSCDDDSTSRCIQPISQLPEQIFLLSYLNSTLVVTSDPVVINFTKVTSTHPHHYCNGIFTVPKCGDGIYNIVVAATGGGSLIALTRVSLIVVDATQLFSNTLRSVTIDITHPYESIVINYPLKEGYRVYVTADGSGSLDGSSYFNLTRVA